MLAVLAHVPPDATNERLSQSWDTQYDQGTCFGGVLAAIHDKDDV